MGPAALPADSAAHEALQTQLAGLRVAPPIGEPTSPLAAMVSGRSYRFDAASGIRSITLTFGPDEALYVVEDTLGAHTVPVALNGAWRESTTGMGFYPSRTIREQGQRPVAASGAWEDEHTFALKLCFTETPFHPTARFRFQGDSLTISLDPNVGWDGAAGVEFTGMAE
jgi:hypothetical protein